MHMHKAILVLALASCSVDDDMPPDGSIGADACPDYTPTADRLTACRAVCARTVAYGGQLCAVAISGHACISECADGVASAEWCPGASSAGSCPADSTADRYHGCVRACAELAIDGGQRCAGSADDRRCTLDCVSGSASDLWCPAG